MSYRDDRRPGSFRGVPFECRAHTLAGGRRGAHRMYPGRDEGDVSDLGLKDRRISLDAYLIGDDVAAQRAAMIAALSEPGEGTLVHPWLGRLQVVLDPRGDWIVRETIGRERMAMFRIAFIRAAAKPKFPTATRVGRDAIASRADAVLALAAGAGSERMALGGPTPVAAQASSDLIASLEAVEAVRPLAGSAERDPLETFREAALERIGARDASGALTALLGLVEDVMTVVAAGERVLTSPRSVAAATASIMDRPRPVPSAATSIAARRIDDNHSAIEAALRLGAIAWHARATVAQTFDSHDEAFAALRRLDQSIEAEIRAASAAGGNADLARALTDLRAEAREVLLGNAADLIPIARIDPGASYPSLALSWRVSGGIDQAADIVSRNAVAHPLFCPPEAVTVRGVRANA